MTLLCTGGFTVISVTPTTTEISDALIAGFFRFSTDDQRLVHTIYRLLATGHPASVDAIAGASGRAAADVEDRLSSWPAVYRTEAGDVVGFGGLSCQPASQHRVRLSGLGEAWTWCALDPLVLARLLGSRIDVTSSCPTTGETIELSVTPHGVTGLKPGGAVLSLLTPERRFDDDVRQTFCHYVHLFVSPDAARNWTTRHPGTFSISVTDAFEVARSVTDAIFPTVGSDLGETTR